MNELYFSSKVWKLIYKDAGLKFKKWQSDQLSIRKARRIAFEQGYVDQGGYRLTKKGKMWTVLLDYTS